MRLIDADAIKLEKGFFENIDNVPKFFEWLGKQPTIDPVKWIPVTERLPIEDAKSYAPYDEHLSAFVMVTLKGQTWPYKKLTVKLARYSYSRNEWRIANNNLGEVIAWMPLPEPWRKEEDE